MKNKINNNQYSLRILLINTYFVSNLYQLKILKRKKIKTAKSDLDLITFPF